MSRLWSFSASLRAFRSELIISEQAAVASCDKPWLIAKSYLVTARTCLIEIAIGIYSINIYFSYRLFTFRISVYRFEDIILAWQNAGIPSDKKISILFRTRSPFHEIYRAMIRGHIKNINAHVAGHFTSETAAFTRLTSILIKWLIDFLSAQEHIPDAHRLTMIGHV